MIPDMRTDTVQPPEDWTTRQQRRPGPRFWTGAGILKTILREHDIYEARYKLNGGEQGKVHVIARKREKIYLRNLGI